MQTKSKYKKNSDKTHHTAPPLKTHLSEDTHPLRITHLEINDLSTLSKQNSPLGDVCMIILPPHNPKERSQALDSLLISLKMIVSQLEPQATLITIGEVPDLVHVHTALTDTMHYQLWISIKRGQPKMDKTLTALPSYHFGALIHTKYKGALRHTKTRIKYTYCPACNKTTKDYGGKKHTYNAYGTLISDIWRDIPCDLEGNLDPIINRFADLFALETYQTLTIFDCRGLHASSQTLFQNIIEETDGPHPHQPSLVASPSKVKLSQSRLLLGDCLEKLSEIPAESIDFAFADPPYNLGKKYNSYADDLSITEYFSWCDAWLSELARVLRPGRTCAILNIPLWTIRHFLHMETILSFQNWISWDALSFPVRKIMPAHYSILCFSKGPARQLPALTKPTDLFQGLTMPKAFAPLKPLAEWYCLRSNCVRTRKQTQENDRGPLTDLWWDIHRLKHNSRRVDHPCQLPPHLMYRLFAIFTHPGEVILDCFDGAGTSSLTAHQMKRGYIGIEFAKKYHHIAQKRHQEIEAGLDPFRKLSRKLTEKNSRVKRLSKQKYAVPKKTLQLEVRRVAQKLGHLPSRDDVIAEGTYPIKYYDDYFSSWGEVCAAARHEGMVETLKAEKEEKRVAH